MNNTIENNIQFENASLVFQNNIPSGKIGWQSPSNIALVKYWGKMDMQIPCNPSISFTLNNSNTQTRIEYCEKQSETAKVEFYLDEVRKESFDPKIIKFLKLVDTIFPFAKQLDLKIYSHNTFPHSTGIASSASGMSAIALGLCSLEKEHFGTLSNDQDFYQKASYAARLGSGSACRSVYGGLVTWGEIEGMENTSNLYGTQCVDGIHPDFLTFKDSVLIVDSAEKKVSSTIGHGLMDSNPFSEQRFAQARTNVKRIISAMKSGDFDEFIKITESEALTLHAMMMTSDPYFMLMRPNTIKIIEKLFAFREATKNPVCFTLDAGPNIHLLYPKNIEEEVNNWVNSEIKQHLHDFCLIEDEVGNGPQTKTYDC